MRLIYDEAGSGDCVVLIHGHPFNRTLWEPQVAALRDGFRVLPNLEAESEFNSALRAFLRTHAPGR